MFDIVTIGESMVVFNPTEIGPMRHCQTFRMQMAGAESNVAIGLARLGHSVSWCSRVGDDEFGKYIVNTLRAENVDVSMVRFDSDNRTGLMFKEERKKGLSNVYYYRNESAASKLSEFDIQRAWIRKARILHLTGITPALSESCRSAIFQAIKLAKEEGIPISFDLNMRTKLWEKDIAVSVLTSIMKECHYFLPSYQEGVLLSGIDSVKEMAEYFYQHGPRVVVIKKGAEGSYLLDQDGGRWIPPFRVEQVMDSIGAGDAFAAGFLSGILNGSTNEEATRRGNLLGAYSVSVKGDWEGLPSEKELSQIFTVEDAIR
ncbi:2-dehydro-3-deoxygluconokinase [Bacillus niacini]|uniref:2-dehydro-3-deoxygluconokinase n=1 Tax=Neobacillus niacini TaxID=86668 RepID=A0A852TCQ3_9BACI|nr:sugar kinase [Neobacillus niacini]NYE05735.1 2-dehydro-3-deoxygluconokinase [Neobacillus niacini]